MRQVLLANNMQVDPNMGTVSGFPSSTGENQTPQCGTVGLGNMVPPVMLVTV